ncbi:3',5'-cyclic AMP phosphodiesterase CpdA [Clostridium acetobutylicum]|uniref:Predicted phosphohydrolase, Icc family n=1 Tax=Clostridium acetobutylicum (strain ATCC 824 / DSM 792 / JCM 1419 / IAM 19013 / LMG 5710 / NBRC 13948 / NRRL B-527 / VKM B-1787 / 2291 / W) TaxID=272562 RepID=Q97K43_CLOAB|nr:MULTISPECIES: metallophosphoesterase [Clostridium]AAK79052.1 Predicted phosphohydrolase, Icc family [Clostridium acetobutylicum ATCC 824]ADZ20127.1 phosphohydrolase, Icc family [Clostridium acetobutylicum EA 2018]AEI31602.1 Icc family phosphohydrolase [Clostridium acetobutylicum DSM 1731]AWV81693.1 phosphohydrolase [Clostridium acetobutylicum]MBC2395232.1 phosphohydrolase [Clostridium acetobutylicum]
MKKSKKLLKTLTATICTMGIICATSITVNAQYSFDVISDTHIGADSSWGACNHLTDALTCIKNSIKAAKSNPNSPLYKNYLNDQCIVVDGDIVDYASDQNYKELSDTILGCKDSNLPYVYFNIGNHEFKTQSSPNTEWNYTDALNFFNTKTNAIQSSLLSNAVGITTTGRNNSYDLQYINNKNSRLFFLGTDELPSDAPDTSTIGSSQLGWLSQAINDNSNEGKQTSKGKKPMFIFSHQPVYSTVYGSDRDDWGYINKDASYNIKNLLNGHNEIVMFTGHTHKQFDNNDPWNSGNGYALNGDSSAHIFSVPSTGEVDSNGPEGYHVTVFSDGIVVTGVKYQANGTCKTMNTYTIDF